MSVGAPPELEHALRSLLAQSVPVEIVVVNSGGGDPARRLPPGAEGVKIVTCRTVLWPGAARNRGIAASRAPWIAFLAGDCRAEPDWASTRLLRHRRGAAAVASAVLNSHPGNVFAAASHFCLFGRRLPHSRRPILYGASYSRQLFHRYGLFAEHLRIGEDTEFRSRLARPDLPIWAPEVLTTHNSPTGFASMVADMFRRGVRSGRHWPPEKIRPYDLIVLRYRNTARWARSTPGDPRISSTPLWMVLPFVAICLCIYAAGVLRGAAAGRERKHGRRHARKVVQRLEAQQEEARRDRMEAGLRAKLARRDRRKAERVRVAADKAQRSED